MEAFSADPGCASSAGITGAVARGAGGGWCGPAACRRRGGGPAWKKSDSPKRSFDPFVYFPTKKRRGGLRSDQPVMDSRSFSMCPGIRRRNDSSCVTVRFREV
ncbi:hypothetical protein GCM10010361_59550 [Streptomyces olivaceiscleroticus]|uniref:Uncharacterized protein n=1 Tax=Streptomyces olivaceiscleroticus TaxID=68245 RepID=A0ABN1AYU9_9ACTN